MGIVRDLYYARKMSAGLKLPAPTVALLIKRLRLAAAMGGDVTKTVSGNTVHITDALAKAALSVLASIEPIQDLHGYDHPWPAGGGKNICPPDIEQGSFDGSGINTAPTDATYPTRIRTQGYIPVNGGATITVSATGSAAYYTVSGYAVNDYTTPRIQSTSWIALGNSCTINADVKYIRIAFRKEDTSANITPSEIANVMCEYGASATSYAPYSNICPISGRTGLSVYVGPTQDQQDATTYSVEWTTEAGTVYGGTLDVVTGVLTVDMVNIPSYNGETINEPWLSSMDAYAEGTTPTIGAQVVYTLATPLTYQLSAQEVQMLLGENYVWSSSGDTVSVTYYAEGNANPLQSLNILLGGNYSNPKTADDVSDKEALEIILGGNK